MIGLLEDLKDELMGTYAGTNLKWYQLLANRVVYHHRLFCIHSYIPLTDKILICRNCGKSKAKR